jgi:hypothetical protein
MSWQQNGSHIYTVDPERRLIARLCYEGDETDARLHSTLLAAPDLLEALEALFVDYAEFEGCYCGQIVGGCAQGTGKPLGKCGHCLAEKAITKAGGSFMPKVRS